MGPFSQEYGLSGPGKHSRHGVLRDGGRFRSRRCLAVIAAPASVAKKICLVNHRSTYACWYVGAPVHRNRASSSRRTVAIAAGSGDVV